jgi:ketosteroid isomerase-like protein
MDTAIITGAFALGGVALGWLGSWVQAGRAARHSDVRELDQSFAQAVKAADDLVMEATLMSSGPPEWGTEQRRAYLRNTAVPLHRALSTASLQVFVRGDWRLKDAANACDAAGSGLAELVLDSSDRAGELSDEIKAALKQLQVAYRLARTRRWHWLTRRELIAEYERARRVASQRPSRSDQSAELG